MAFNNGIDDANIETTAGDAIALSLVFDCPLYVSEEVLDVCGIVTDEEGNLVPDEEPKKSKKKRKAEPVISVEDMRKMMEEAISNEEYELAAKLRDQILSKSNLDPPTHGRDNNS